MRDDLIPTLVFWSFPHEPGVPGPGMCHPTNFCSSATYVRGTSTYVAHDTYPLSVPSRQTRNSFILGTLWAAQRNTLIVGASGAGKTVLAFSELARLPESHAQLAMNFSATTDSGTTQVRGLLYTKTRKLVRKRVNQQGLPAQPQPFPVCSRHAPSLRESSEHEVNTVERSCRSEQQLGPRNLKYKISVNYV